MIAGDRSLLTVTAMTTGGLDPTALVAAAEQMTGLGHWGCFEQSASALAVLCRSLDDEADLHLAGRVVARDELLRSLTNRLLVEHHQAGDGTLTGPAPIVVTGMPRAGTTLLHQLLTLDDAHRAVRYWEAMRPAAAAQDRGRPQDDTGSAVAAARTESDRRLARIYRRSPGLLAVHEMATDAPEECAMLLQTGLLSSQFENTAQVPAYTAHLVDADMAGPYRLLRRQLALLEADTDGARAPQRWVLKNPDHLRSIGVITDTFGPGTVIVWCHRNPVDVVASWCSLVERTRGTVSSVDRSSLGPEWLARLSAGHRAATRTLAERDDMVVVHVAYDDLVAAPAATVERIYAAAGEAFTGVHAARCDRYVTEHPQHRHGPHRYDLGDYGLTAEDVTAAFAGYDGTPAGR